MILTNILQWLAIAMALIPTIYFMLNKRELRRLLLQKIKFRRLEDNGLTQNYDGYILSWQSYIHEKRKVIDTPQNKRLPAHQQEIQLSTTFRTFVIVEPAQPHPGTGYKPQLVETNMIEFL